MANITELQLQGDSTVHKLNDARITTTAVTTATHFLATDSSISSIAPITATNLASVLGGFRYITIQDGGDFNDCTELACYQGSGANISNSPFQYSCFVFSIPRDSPTNGVVCVQIGIGYLNNTYQIRKQWGSGNWTDWEEISTDIPSFYKDYQSLNALCNAVGVSMGATDSYVSDLNVTGRQIITGMFNVSSQNSPDSSHFGCFVYIPSGFNVGDFGFQFAVTMDINNANIYGIYVRGRWGSATWGSWTNIL